MAKMVGREKSAEANCTMESWTLDTSWNQEHREAWFNSGEANAHGAGFANCGGRGTGKCELRVTQ